MAEIQQLILAMRRQSHEAAERQNQQMAVMLEALRQNAQAQVSALQEQFASLVKKPASGVLDRNSPTGLNTATAKVEMDFRLWRYKVQSWLSGRYTGTSRVFELVEQLEEPISDDDFETYKTHCPEVADMSRTLFTFLGSNTDGDPLTIIQRGPQHSEYAGLEAMRRLSKEFAPFGEISTMLLLRQYLKCQPVAIHKLRSALESSEETYRKSVFRGKVKLPDVLRRLVLIEYLVEPTLSHIQLRLTELLDYDSLRKQCCVTAA